MRRLRRIFRQRRAGPGFAAAISSRQVSRVLKKGLPAPSPILSYASGSCAARPDPLANVSSSGSRRSDPPAVTVAKIAGAVG